MMDVYFKQFPRHLRAPGNYLSGNNIYSPAGELLGQLENAHKVQATAEQVGRLANIVGPVSSVINVGISLLNLGVCVAGFRRMGQALSRIEDRLETVSHQLDKVDAKLDRVIDLVGILDQKVETLVDLNVEQLAALADIHQLIMSFETARVKTALDGLEIRCAQPQSARRDEHIIEYAGTLDVFQSWLRSERFGVREREGSIPVRTELLRTEVLIALAGVRARCIADDVGYAVATLARIREETREELQAMIDQAGKDGLRSLMLPTTLLLVNQEMERVSTNLTSSSEEFRKMSELGREALESTDDDVFDELFQMFGEQAIEKEIEESEKNEEERERKYQNQIFAIEQGGVDRRDIVEALAWLNGDSIEETTLKILESMCGGYDGNVEYSNIAGIAAAFRLGQSVEAALAICTVIETGGELMRPLLLEAEGTPDAPALLVDIPELRKAGSDTP